MMKPFKIEQSITPRDQIIKRYMKDLDKIPQLSPSDEYVLAKKMRNGDKSAMDKLVSANLRFVISVAKGYAGSNRSFGDLISDGNVGLLEAVKRFDPSLGFKFISFAVFWIRQAMILNTGSQERMVRLPMNQVRGISKVNSARTNLAQQMEREPSPNEISAHCNLSAAQVIDIISIDYKTISFNKPLCDHNESTLLDTIGSSDESKLPGALEHESMHVDLYRVLNCLPARERLIIVQHYGLETGVAKDIDEIAYELKLTRERTRQLKHKAIARLQETKSSSLLRSYL